MGLSSWIVPSTPANFNRKEKVSGLIRSTNFFFKKTGKKANPGVVGYLESDAYLRLIRLNPSTPTAPQNLRAISKNVSLARAFPWAFLKLKRGYGCGYSLFPSFPRPVSPVRLGFNAYARTQVTAFFFVSSHQALSAVRSVSIRPMFEQTQLALTLCSEATKLRGIFTILEFNPEKKAKLSVTPHHAVLAEVPAASIAAMFGYSRRFQRASFIRVSFFKHLRRYILTLNSLSLDIRVVGVLRQFRLFFKTLNTATNQMFKHPLHGGYLADVACTPHKIAGQVSSREELRQHLKVLLTENALVPDDSLAELTAEAPSEEYTTLVSNLTEFFWPLFKKILSGRTEAKLFRKEALIRRYTLQWNRVIFLKTTPHTLLKKKRARSIKKRRTKRLVKKTKYRFWAL